MIYSFYHNWQGAWWNERNDRVTVGNFITWPRWGIPFNYQILIVFMMNFIEEGVFFCLIFSELIDEILGHDSSSIFYRSERLASDLYREFALEVCQSQNVRRYYQLQSLKENPCLRVFSGFFWQERCVIFVFETKHIIGYRIYGEYKLYNYQKDIWSK